MRRRYGIPDNDQRPFNVAYASARLAQEDKRKIQDRLWNVSTLDQLNTVTNGQTGSGMMDIFQSSSVVLRSLLGDDYGAPNQQTLTPVTLQVSGYDRNAKPMCVSLVRSPQ